MKRTEFIRILVARSGICEPTVRQTLRTIKDPLSEAMADGICIMSVVCVL